MRQAARAIIIENGKLLVMHRNKYGSQYYTLVGGGVDDGENMEQALVREVYEETGLQVIHARLVFVEQHPDPYNEQFIFLCQVAPHGEVAIQELSEEALLNRQAANTHRPVWISLPAFANLPFRTPGLHQAIRTGLKKGFPEQPVPV